MMIFLGVKGVKPKKDAGRMFECPLHTWAHVLRYVEGLAPVIYECMQPHPTMGGGPALNAEKARQLAEKLYEDIYGGGTKRHIAAFPKHCQGHLQIATVRQFAEFLKDCGGFKADDEIGIG